MIVIPAKQLHTILAREKGSVLETDLGLITQNHEARRDFLLERVYSEVSRETLEAATCFILSETDINFSPETLNRILKLFPVTRINLAEYGLGDTETAEGLLDATYTFFIGCPAPTFGDTPEGDTLLKDYLHERAIAAGYEVILSEV